MATSSDFQRQATLLGARLHAAFDATTTWVTQLSWWKFFLFAAVAMAAADILQNELFSSAGEEVVVRADENSKKKTKKPESTILIDDSGIHFNPRKPMATPVAPQPPQAPVPPAKPADPANTPPPPVVSTLPDGSESVHIELPPQIGEELSNAIENAVETAAEEKVTRYHKQASTWFRSFVLLLILALLAMKALVGGKKRAEAETLTANAAAERESMQRQLSETKMQMMQAQVEPHFLFNTLANLKYLMRTEPAAALTMLDHLTDYLHSALPDLRAVSSTVGCELGLAQAYLSIMQIRMGERLRFTIEASDAVRALPMPPAMLISLVENALKHGLEGWPQPGTVRIEAALDDGLLALRVHDDGAGFGGSAAQGAGLGLSNIHTRLALLYGGAAELDVVSGGKGGVSASLRLPLSLPAAAVRA